MGQIVELSWDAIGAVGEVVGGVGVIVTLIYLAIQVRQNTKASEKQNLRDATEFLHSCYRSVIEDQELADISVRGMKDYAALTEAERERFHYLNVTQLQAATTIIELRGAEDTSIPSMTDVFDRRMLSAGYREWWIKRGQHIVARDYVDLIDGYYRKHNEAVV